MPLRQRQARLRRLQMPRRYVRRTFRARDWREHVVAAREWSKARYAPGQHSALDSTPTAAVDEMLREGRLETEEWEPVDLAEELAEEKRPGRFRRLMKKVVTPWIRK